MNPKPKYAIHHETCDSCGAHHILVFHIRYDLQPNSYRICLACSKEMMETFVPYVADMRIR
jgi:hypothetical protein